MNVFNFLSETLTSEELGRFIKNKSNGDISKFLKFCQEIEEEGRFDNIVGRAFVWMATPEGQEYWDDVRRKVDRAVSKAQSHQNKSEMYRELEPMYELVRKISEQLESCPNKYKTPVIKQLLTIISKNI